VNARYLARRLVPRSVRNALRRPALTYAWLRDETAYRLGRTPQFALRDDWTVRCHPASVVPFQLHRTEGELCRELDSFVALCKADMVLLDIGAHYGLFTLAALRYGGPGARAITVEPSAEASRILRINVELSGAKERVVILQAAAGAQDGEVAMLTTGPNAAHYMIGVDAGTSRPDVSRIRQLAVASIVARAGIVPTHVKIDVEGFEEDVISGGAGVFRECRPVILLELHGQLVRQRDRNPRAVLEQLIALGYSRFERDGKRIEPDAAAALEIVRLVCLPG
jgi:FkbM family methyltransferase